MAQKKKQLVAAGKLDKFGRPNPDTPQEYLRSLGESAGSQDAGDGQPLRETTTAVCDEAVKPLIEKKKKRSAEVDNSTEAAKKKKKHKGS
jgi:H/ACA ribonucleoprotein complex subunit 4